MSAKFEGKTTKRGENYEEDDEFFARPSSLRTTENCASTAAKIAHYDDVGRAQVPTDAVAYVTGS